ncbi:hypothetical protein BDZ45DRAFT_746684 [Acephala macrosclerotiorum]|nr:hypothetical protein BDZ45DRAFT_746684 [Acephala macrosclerotiorum]
MQASHSKIGNAIVGGSAIDITLPYFPIMRAANDTQYTPGRTFPQEAYLTADYEREKFYVSETNFAGAPEHIIAILSVNATSTSTSTPTSTPNSPGPKGFLLAIIVGVVVGAFVLGPIAIVTFLVMRYCRRAAKAKAETPAPAEEDDSYPFDKKGCPKR